MRTLFVALVLFVVLVPAVGPVLAQGDRENPAPLGAGDPLAAQLGNCFTDRYPVVAGGPEDATAGASRGGLGNPKPLLDNARFCAEAYAAEVLLPTYGQPLYVGLALITIVWTGITMMFSGGVDMGQVISLIFLLGFVVLLLYSYELPYDILGATSFPGFVSNLGSEFADDLTDAAWQSVVSAWDSGLLIWTNQAQNRESIYRMCRAAESRGTQGGTYGVSRGAGTPTSGLCFSRQASGAVLLVYAVFLFLAVLLGAIPLLVAYFSYLWAYFSLILITLVGPLMIPFGLIPQTSFLMWGWIRSIVGATVQMMVGGGVFMVVVTLMLNPLQRYTLGLAQIMQDTGSIEAGDAFGRGVGLFLEFLPVAVIAMLGAYKTSELTAMIMSGGAPPASGLGQRGRDVSSAKGAVSGIAGGAAGVGRGAMAAGGAVASGGALMAARVLSAATRAGKGSG